MVNSIVTAISTALYALFGDGYEIYAYDVRQGLQEPCFFIDLLEGQKTQRLGSRFLLQCPFDIHYFPTDGSDNAGMYEVAMTLLEGLEFIPLLNGNLLHGTEMRFQIQDDVLHFFVNYDVHMRKQADGTYYMEELAVGVGVPEGTYLTGNLPSEDETDETDA